MARGVGHDEREDARWRQLFDVRRRPLAVTVTATGLSLGFAAWPSDPVRAATFVLLVLAAVLAAPLPPDRQDAADSGSMPLVFVVHVLALILLGPHALTLVAAAGSVRRECGDPPCWPPIGGLMRVAAAVAAALAAGATYSALHAWTPHPGWPWLSVPMAAAVLVHCLATTAASDVATPLATGRRTRWRLDRAFRGVPSHTVGAAAAGALAEIVHRQAWPVLLVVAVPLALAGRGYIAQLARSDAEYRRREILGRLGHGVSAVDSRGRVTFCNDALVRLVQLARRDMLGRPLGDVAPAVAGSALPGALEDVLQGRSPGAVPDLELAGPHGVRILRVDVLPDVDGAVVHWHDVTARRTAEREHAEAATRLTLAADGASDGLWSWNLRTHEFHVSARWKSLVGPSGAQAGPARPEDWLDRVHPDDVVPLKETLDAHLSGRTDHFRHEHRVRHEDGTYRWFLCRGRAARDADGSAECLAGSLTDITDQADVQERIRRAGSRDPLTGLSNRGIFVETVGKSLDRHRRYHTGRFAVLYLDLDRFKVVNDSLGHLVGDELLIAVARRLESCLRPGDVVARLGGDEFAILLNGINDDTQANVVAFRIQDALATPFSIGGREVFTSVSIGIAVSRPEHGSPEDVMRDADAAMYQAKARGKARHELFDADMHARALDRLNVENDLRHAVRTGALDVHYQPIVALGSGKCVGFEALIRWSRHGKAVSPAVFIPLAEEMGLIEPLGTLVLRESCGRFARWRRRFPAADLDCITVNVSARQLAQSGFVRLVEEIVEESGIRPGDLRLEITETALMDSSREVAAVLQGLRGLGVRIYLDDFGTGYSSLSHLHTLPVDALKIDRSFVRSLLLSDRPAIVESILALARTLETGVVAEGVESDVQALELARLGCRHAQGYFFSPPLSAGAVDELLAANRPLGQRIRPVPGTPWTGNEPEPEREPIVWAAPMSA